MNKLVGIKEASKQLGVSQSTLRRWDREGKLRPDARTATNQRRYSLDSLKKYQAGGIDPLQLPTYLPPGGGGWVIPNIQQYSGLMQGINKFYVSPDEAVRNSRENARTMFNNLVIREPLQSRMLAVAELPWHIEPEDKKNPEQMRIAQGIQRIIEETPDFLKYRYSLLWATWFGRYGVQNKYAWDFSTGGKRLVVRDWTPVHGDSLVFKWDSNDVGIYVGTYLGYPGTKELTTEAAITSRAHVLNDTDTLYQDENGNLYHKLGFNERDAFVIHTHDLMAGDFLTPETAGGVKGLGIRSAVYWSWYVLQQITGWMIEFLERVGTGITIWRYLRGNEESYNAVKQIAESNSNQAAILFPVDPAVGHNLEDVQRIEPSPVGMENMLKIVDDYFGSQVRRYIVGQDATSRPVPSGMNSGVAEAHENTFARIVKYDALNLQETLTHQLVRVIQRWSFPEATFKCKFVVDVEKPEVEKYMQGVKDFVELGGDVDEDEVRGVLGLSKPDAGAKVLSKQQTQPGVPGMPGMGQQPRGEDFFDVGDEDQDEDQDQDDEAQPFKFDWSPYKGPRGGQGWKNDSGDIVYGDKPGEGEKGGTATKEPPAKASTKKARRELKLGVKSLVTKGGELAKAKAEAAKKLGKDTWDRLPPKVQKSVTVVHAVSKKVLYAIDTPLRLGLNLTKQVARERGLPEEHVKKVARVVNAVDQLSTLPVVGVYTRVAKAMVPAIGPIAGYIPVAALSYVGYSTLRNPFATMRAARHLVRNFKTAVTTHMADGQEEIVASLLEAYEQHKDNSDWFDAILHAALDQTRELKSALKLAEEVIQDHPEGGDGEKPETFRLEGR